MKRNLTRPDADTVIAAKGMIPVKASVFTATPKTSSLTGAID